MEGRDRSNVQLVPFYNISITYIQIDFSPKILASHFFVNVTCQKSPSLAGKLEVFSDGLFGFVFDAALLLESFGDGSKLFPHLLEVMVPDMTQVGQEGQAYDCPHNGSQEYLSKLCLEEHRGLT